MTYVSASDDDALEALRLLARTEGIIPALESAHAVAYTRLLAPTLGAQAVLVVNCSGRGDKDMHTLAARLDPTPA